MHQGHLEVSKTQFSSSQGGFRAECWSRSFRCEMPVPATNQLGEAELATCASGVHRCRAFSSNLTDIQRGKRDLAPAQRFGCVECYDASANPQRESSIPAEVSYSTF